MKNCHSIDTILSKLVLMKTKLKDRLKLKASRRHGFSEEDSIYFVSRRLHCHVLLYLSEYNMAYIADGGNVFRSHLDIAVEPRATLNTRLVSLEYNHQLKKDHCSS